MPTHSSSIVITRQWELLKLLSQTRTGKTLNELKNDLNGLGFPIEVRQLERDLKTLQGTFDTIECNDDSKPYTWCWLKPIFANLSLSEAVSWQLVADTIQHLLPLAVLNTVKPYFIEAQKKLESLKQHNHIATWTNKIRVVQPTFPLIPPQINSDIVETIQEGVLHQKQLQISYRPASATQYKDMILHPLALVQRGLVTYVVATANHHTDVRLFALHRIQHAELLTLSATMPTTFDIDNYIDDGKLHFGNGQQIDLQIQVADWLHHILAETPLTANQTIIHYEQKTRIHAQLIYTPQLEWWLLSQAEAVEVIQPTWLRQKIAQRLQAAVKPYIGV